MLGLQEMLRSGVAPGMSSGDAHAAMRDGAAVTSEDDLRRYLRYSGYAEAAYGKRPSEVPVFVPSGVTVSDVVGSKWSSKVLKPAWFIVVDDVEKAVVLAIRGTDNISDALTDAAAASLNFKLKRESGSADSPSAIHGGMLRAALWLMAETHDLLLETLQSERCQGYALTITGHSLGGGCAALISALLNDGLQLPGQEDHPHLQELASRVHAYTFCPAAVASAAVASAYSDVVTALAMESDIVPRFCCTSASALLQEACQFAPAAKERLKARYNETYTAAAKRLDSVAARARLYAEQLAEHKHVAKASSTAHSVTSSGADYATRLAQNEHVTAAVSTAQKAATSGAAYASWASTRMASQAAMSMASLQSRLGKLSGGESGSDKGEAAEKEEGEGGDSASKAGCEEEEGEVSQGKSGEGTKVAKAYIAELDFETTYLSKAVKLFPMGSLIMVRGVFPPQGADGSAVEHEDTPTAVSPGGEESGADAGASAAAAGVETMLRPQDFESYVLVPAEQVQYSKVLLNARMIRDHMLGDVRGYLRLALQLVRAQEQALHK
jgi:hypothetical protein